MRILLVCVALVFQLGCASSQSPTVTAGIASLPDTPAATFSTSGWSYTNTTNPFLLTPDYLTNAMLGVSRLAKGEPILQSTATVPETIDIPNIRSAMADRLRDKSNVTVGIEPIGDRQVVVGRYSDGGKEGVEYAFEFSDHMVLVLLLATPGDYFDSGMKVARRVVETFSAP